MELLSFGSTLSLDISYLGLNLAELLSFGSTLSLDRSYLGLNLAQTFAEALTVALTMSLALAPALSMAMSFLSLPSLSARDADNRSSDSSLEHFVENFKCYLAG